jgi:alpha-D-xyloside xylohydrolase
MHWDDAAKTLTLAAREGSFPGMLQERTFRVVVVTKGHGVGIGESEAAEKTVSYKGERTAVSF